MSEQEAVDGGKDFAKKFGVPAFVGIGNLTGGWNWFQSRAANADMHYKVLPNGEVHPLKESA